MAHLLVRDTHYCKRFALFYGVYSPQVVEPIADSLWPMYINPDSGELVFGTTVTLGARGDSLYEYLLKQVRVGLAQLH
jgi:hypothetical protein